MIFAIVAAILVIILITVVVIAKNPNFSKSSGERGENTVAQILGETIAGQQYVINDLLFCNELRQSCQIDHIFINAYGVWVIETKNYAGYIYGEENQREWTQVLADGEIKNKFYNPVKQNATHIYKLSKCLNANNVFQNVVVFLSRADISHVAAPNVYTEKELAIIKNKITNTFLSVSEMEHYYNLLLKLKDNSTISKDEHIENIRRKREQIRQGICPRCGGKLVLRDGHSGQFFGCSNYPNCKFTTDIDK